MIQFDHLKKAREYSNLPSTAWFYFKHMWWALHMSITLFVWAILMLVHAFIPQLVGFSVVIWMVNYIREMKRQHPLDPVLSKIKFEEIDADTK
jgi:hypothetical protein